LLEGLWFLAFKYKEFMSYEKVFVRKISFDFIWDLFG
jgi:hypothetical protein